MSPDKWVISSDTGGTFTDLVATSPDRVRKELKVLSNGVIKRRISEVHSSSLITFQDSHGYPDNFFQGFFVEVIQGDSLQRSIVEESQGTKLTLATTISATAGEILSLSTGEEAPVLGIRILTETSLPQDFPDLELRCATTRGTNALLTHSGTPPVLFVTSGFRDLPLIGDQTRPDLFAHEIIRPKPLTAKVIEVSERLDAEGKILTPIDLGSLNQAATDLIAEGYRHAAISFLHAYLNPEHETKAAEALLAVGFSHISLSSSLSPSIKYLPRTQTAVVNAYLSPVFDDFLRGIQVASPKEEPLMMTSAGGLLPCSGFSPKDSLLSGPAGGALGAWEIARSSGYSRAIAFDMGGTSTDISRLDGGVDYQFSHEVAGQRILAPAVNIETVAAGGGSICAFDLGELKVGPQSSGASPGPACYGMNGPLTVTDCNLLLGRLEPDRYGVPIDEVAARRAAEKILISWKNAKGSEVQLEELLEGFLALANQKMADAISQVSLSKGYDPADHVLISFGGAGGQHAVAVAEILGIQEILLSPLASVLSAWGLSRAAREVIVEEQILMPLEEWIAVATERELKLECQARHELQSSGVPKENHSTSKRLYMVRVRGQETALQIEASSSDEISALWKEQFQAIYGYDPPAGIPLEVESLKILLSEVPPSEIPVTPHPRKEEGTPVYSGNATPDRRGQCWISGLEVTIPIYEWENLKPGELISGPAKIIEPHSVVLILERWKALLMESGNLFLWQE